MEYQKNINGKLALGYGSKYQLLRMLGWHRNELNETLGALLSVDGNINWLDFAYAGPCDKELLNLDFIPELKDAWKEYWACGSAGGINWDAVGLSADGTYILVEAKAHIVEMDNSANGNTASQTKNNRQIDQFIHKYNIPSSAEIWRQHYYQLANRLVACDYLLSKGYKAKLVYILFENGYEYNRAKSDSATREQWLEEMDRELVAMGIKGTEAEQLINICIINCNRK